MSPTEEEEGRVMVKPGEQLVKKSEACVGEKTETVGERAPKPPLTQSQTENKKVSSPPQLFLAPSLARVRSLTL